MQKDNKHRKIDPSDFIRYRQGEMSGKEMNAFEKELQKDPFAMEAEEGLSSVTDKAAADDLKILSRRLRSRTVRKKNYMAFRIAASVAVLMIISTVFIIIERNNTTQELSVTAGGSEPAEIKQSQPLKKDAEREFISAPERINNTDNLQDRKKEPVAEEMMIEKKESDDAEQKSRVSEPSSRSIVQMKADESEKSVAPLSVPELAEGKIISVEDNKPLEGATVKIKGTERSVMTNMDGEFRISVPDTDKVTLVADYSGMKPKEFAGNTDTRMQVKLEPSPLSQTVVAGYGTKKSEELTEVKGYLPPVPVDGMNVLEKYIRENINRPDSSTTGQRVVVVISFLVTEDGSVDSLKIIRSPGSGFSDEAIRLIKSGPAWKPATENGKPVKDEVRMRIVFE